jgi:hypothetical protein
MSWGEVDEQPFDPVERLHRGLVRQAQQRRTIDRRDDRRWPWVRELDRVVTRGRRRRDVVDRSVARMHVLDHR